MKPCLLVAGLWAAALAGAVAAPNPKYDAKDNWVIVDRINSRIIEVEPESRTVVWDCEYTLLRNVTNWIAGPRDAERYKGRTLVTIAGLPAGLSEDYPDGAADARVVEIDRKGKIKWQYGTTGNPGSGPNQLNNPATAVYLPNKGVLIADQGNHRVIHVRQKGKKSEIIWQYGTSGVAGAGFNELNNPMCAQRRPNGNYLIADTGNHRIIEVNRKNEILWQYGDPGDTGILNNPTYVCRLRDDTFLITDSGNQRIRYIDREGSNLFTRVTANAEGGVAESFPLRAVPLKDGFLLIADQLNHRIVKLDEFGNQVAEYGTVGVAGRAAGFLHGPADVKVVDDFTGLTAPKSSGGGGFSYPGSPF